MCLIALKWQKKISQTIVYEPSRNWINGILNSINSKLAKALVLKSKRFLYCTRTVLRKYHQILQSAVLGIIPELIWTADETIIDLNRRKKVIIPD